jgi:hypothetical protein
LSRIRELGNCQSGSGEGYIRGVNISPS